MSQGEAAHQIALDPQPTAVVIVPQAPVVITQNGGCCRGPANASTPVKVTRGASIAIIIVHVIALAAYGLYMWSQRSAIIVGVVMGSIVLCQFSKGAYTVAVVFFILGAICDVWATVMWGITTNEIANDDYYGDDMVRLLQILTLAPAVGAVSFMVGAIGALKAICNWEESGAPDALGANSGGVQVHHPSVPAIHLGVPQPPPQPFYPQDSKGGQPALASVV